MLGFILHFIVQKVKLFSEDFREHFAAWALSYTGSILAFIHIHPSEPEDFRYIMIYKSCFAIITGLSITVGNIVIKHLYNKFFNKNDKI